MGSKLNGERTGRGPRAATASLDGECSQSLLNKHAHYEYSSWPSCSQSCLILFDVRSSDPWLTFGVGTEQDHGPGAGSVSVLWSPFDPVAKVCRKNNFSPFFVPMDYLFSEG